MKDKKHLIFSLTAAALITLMISAGILQRVDKWAQDWFFQRPGVTSGDIVIIGIDDTDFAELGPYSTWDRNIIASVLETLAEDPANKPAVTAIDILYIGHSSEQADLRLAEAAGNLGNVVTATIAEFGDSITWENGRASSIDTAIVNYEQPYEELLSCTTQGHINAVSDRDGVMRHALLYVDPDQTDRVYSLNCEAARLFLAKQGKELQLPSVSGNGFFYIPYTAKPGGYYDGVSVADLLKGEVPSSYWSGKIVLIGPYAPALQDAYFTPIDKGEQMYGVEIHANLIQCMLEGNYKRDMSDLPQLVFLFVVLAAAMMLFLKWPVHRGGILCAGLCVAGPALTMALYSAGLLTHPLWLPAGSIVSYILALIDHYASAIKERQRLALENERISTELALASRIQSSALPKEFPVRKEFDLYASMTPAKEVGGDFYDFFMIDEDHLALVIADVSGKGVPAALFMMVSSSLIHHAAMSLKEFSAAQALKIVNDQVCSRNPEEMFVTVWLGILELSTGKLTAANAGHEYPMVKKAGESFELLKDRHGLVIGAMGGIRYRDYELQLEPGAKLFVYTDGVAEATNSRNELFGTQRLVEVLIQNDNSSPPDILKNVKSAVDEFVGDAPQFDDLTLLCVEYKGK